MDKKNLIVSLQQLKEAASQRKFKQTIDFVINLQSLDLKKPDQQVDIFATLPFGRGRKVKVCAFVAAELLDQSRAVCDKTIVQDEFELYQKDKKLLKKLAAEYDFFIAQATIMPKLATVFGKALGTKGKMPNPKAGCVVPPNANLKQLYEKLQNMVRVKAKTTLGIQCSVGNQETPIDHVAENIQVLYNQVLHALPNEKNNIKSLFMKYTMSHPIHIDLEGKAVKQ
ncbi:hypothetical protein HZB02_05390 [Candidatus Woesearchaeota archaeon]|nr:hypothetical protein [Candidatus Woesearchaeota archaeon]